MLAVPLSELPDGATGTLALSVGGVDSAQDPVEAGAMHGRATEVDTRAGNTIAYTICPASGCPVELTPVAASFAAARYSANEGQSVEVTVTLDTAPGREVTIPIRAVAMGASEEQYELSAESLTFGPEETSGSFTVTAVEDDADANPEMATLTLSFDSLPDGVSAGVQESAEVEITDNDDPSVTVSFGSAEYAAMEGGDAVMVRVRLSGAPEREVTVPITAQGQGGASPGDYSGVPASVTFGPEETGKSFAVTAEEDDDRRNESLTLAFGALPEGVSVSAGDPASAEVMLLDNDAGEALIVMLGTPSARSLDEGGAVEIPVTVHPAPEQAQLTVTYGLTTGTAAAADYNDETGGTVTIAAGESEGTIRVTVVDDDLSEPAETFRVMLTGVTSSDDGNEPARLGPEASLGADLTISASDPLMVSLSGPARVSEGQTATYTLTLDGGVGTADVTATLAVGTASTADEDDYGTVPSMVTVPAGQSQEEFSGRHRR